MFSRLRRNAKTPKFLKLDQKIEIIVSFDAGMKTSAIACERRMAESSVRAIIKRQDQIKELVGRSSHLSPNTVVRKKSVVIKGIVSLEWHENMKSRYSLHKF